MSNVVIAFPTEMGLNYQVQYKNSLTDTNWTALGNPILGNGAVHGVGGAASKNSRFFRVKIE
jgi:hypothetical protein